MPHNRNTLQKEIILRTVRATATHPTAEEIYRIIEEDHPSISRATVYRNLGQMAEAGQIKRVSHLDAADRFDFNTAPHYHFRCLSCNGVFDVDLPYNSGMLAEVPNKEGFLFSGYELVFTGLCPQCQKQHGQRS